MKRPNFPRPIRAAGYTLFEIMLVLGIIAVLVGSAIYLLVGNIDVARESRVEADIQSISTQLRVYEMQNLRPPTSDQGLKALVTRPGGDPPPRRWKQLLERVPVDPWGEEYVYYWPGKKNAAGFDLFSKGADRQEGGGDDIGNDPGE
jgi:general secretion pathway protein G